MCDQRVARQIFVRYPVNMVLLLHNQPHVGVAEKGQLRGNQLLKDLKDLFLSVT